jgi:hypothetical protein
MSTTDNPAPDARREREERALDALIVLCLRTPVDDDDDIDPRHLPELTNEECKAMDALGPPEEFVARMRAEADRRAAMEAASDA